MALCTEAACARPSQRMAARDWIDRQDELARALRGGSITGLGWMSEVERLSSEIDVAQLMGEVDRARVTAAAQLPTNDPHKRSIRFLDETGSPRKLAYAAALFDFAPENVITPHGHRHMVSAHLVVQGRFRVRNFDRLGDEPGAMIVRPTRDYVAATGHLSAMSAARDNVHWFVPEGGPAMTFDVIVSGIDPGQPDYEIQAIDPLAAKARPDGTIRAPIIDFDSASAKYHAGV